VKYQVPSGAVELPASVIDSTTLDHKELLPSGIISPKVDGKHEEEKRHNDFIAPAFKKKNKQIEKVTKSKKILKPKKHLRKIRNQNRIKKNLEKTPNKKKNNQIKKVTKPTKNLKPKKILKKIRAQNLLKKNLKKNFNKKTPKNKTPHKVTKPAHQNVKIGEGANTFCKKAGFRCRDCDACSPNGFCIVGRQRGDLSVAYKKKCLCKYGHTGPNAKFNTLPNTIIKNTLIADSCDNECIYNNAFAR